MSTVSRETRYSQGTVALPRLPVPAVMKPWGLWLDGAPWGRRRFWTRSGAQQWADECNNVRRVLGLAPLVEVYNRFEPGL